MPKAVAEPWNTSKWLPRYLAAKYLHVTDAELQGLIDAGEIPASELTLKKKGPKGSHPVYVHMDDLDAWMRSHPYRPSPAPVRATARPRSSPDGMLHVILG